jgi:hypothetical protein
MREANARRSALTVGNNDDDNDGNDDGGGDGDGVVRSGRAAFGDKGDTKGKGDNSDGSFHALLCLRYQTRNSLFIPFFFTGDNSDGAKGDGDDEEVNGDDTSDKEYQRIRAAALSGDGVGVAKGEYDQDSDKTESVVFLPPAAAPLPFQLDDAAASNGNSNDGNDGSSGGGSGGGGGTGDVVAALVASARAPQRDSDFAADAGELLPSTRVRETTYELPGKRKTYSVF